LRPRLSTRSARDRTKNDLARLVERIRAEGRPLLDLTESNPTVAGVEYPADVLALLCDPAALRYEPRPFGLEKAREAVAGVYREAGLDVDASRVVLTASTSETYAFLFKLL